MHEYTGAGVVLRLWQMRGGERSTGATAITMEQWKDYARYSRYSTNSISGKNVVRMLYVCLYAKLH